MNTQTLAISGISIKQDSHGRYCLNDLHKAAGEEQRHRPKYWLENQQANDLIEFLTSEQSIGGIPPIFSKQGLGTFVVKELVYAYAMWISAKFHITVIRAYDALVNPKPYGLKEPVTISNEQIGELYTRVCAISSDGKIRTAIWSRFKNHFRINTYQTLPAEKYDEALIYVEKLHAEYHPKSEPVLTEQHYRRVMNRADYLSKTQCASPLMSIVETIRKEFKVSDIRNIPEAKFAQLCNFLNFSPEQNERDLLVDYFRANDLIERMKKDYIILKKDDPCIIPHFVQQVETLLLPELITQSAAALAVRL